MRPMRKTKTKIKTRLSKSIRFMRSFCLRFVFFKWSLSADCFFVYFCMPFASSMFESNLTVRIWDQSALLPFFNRKISFQIIARKENILSSIDKIGYQPNRLHEFLWINS